MPLESEYADDVDFLDEDEICLQFILPVANHVLKEWNLNINCTKTEFAHFFLAEKGLLDNKNQPIRDNEPWRKTKLLGSFMCSTYDIKRRCISGHIAFNNYKNVWLQGKKISVNRLVQVYEAMVVQWRSQGGRLPPLSAGRTMKICRKINKKNPTFQKSSPAAGNLILLCYIIH